MGVSCNVDSVAGKMGLVGEQNVMNHMGVKLIQRHNSNRLHMSAGSRCWMRWMLYGYIPSVCSLCQTLMRGTQKQAEIILVVVCGLCWTMSGMFSSPSTFRCTWCSTRRFTLGKEPLSRRCWWMQVNTCLSGIRHRGYHSRYYFDSSSGVTIAKPVHKMHIGVFFTGKCHVYSFCSLHGYHSTKWLLSLLSEALLAL